ncbi:MAG: CinA family protein [Rhodospirillales bacterium]|nr:CinA family protein [Rhodospirillales bacterium]
MDRMTELGAALGQLLKDRGESIAIAESSTGGLVSAALLSVPGASEYFMGGGIIYTRAARRGLLDFSELDAQMRAATQDYASRLASDIRDRLGATWGIGESGATGPTGNSYGDAPGHTCFAIVGPVSRAMTLETGSDVREANMWRFAEETIAFARQTIADADN